MRRLRVTLGLLLLLTLGENVRVLQWYQPWWSNLLVYSWAVLLGVSGIGLMRGGSAWPVLTAGVSILIGTVGLGISAVPFVVGLLPVEARTYTIIAINGAVLFALIAVEFHRRKREAGASSR